MTNKTFAVAGISTQNGNIKVRFANDIMRVKLLAKNGHSDITMETLPHEMTKTEAVAHLVAIGLGQGDSAVEAAVQAAVKKYGVVFAETVPAEAELVAE
jgi:hypothetical protein